MGEPIESHGIVGNMRTAALVGLDGAVDFLCWPCFGSPGVFASLLDDERGGRFEMTPLLDAPRRRQPYLSDTDILLTRFPSAQGVAEVSDLMPVGGPSPGQRLVGRAKAVRGDVRFRMRCAPRFDYARAGHTVQEEAGTLVFASAGEDGTALRLRASRQFHVERDESVAEFELAQGQSAVFVLEDAAYGGRQCFGRRAIRHGRVQGHVGILAAMGRAVQLPWPVAQRGEPILAGFRR